MTPLLYIGLMSGTSLDGVDGVLAAIEPPPAAPVRVLTHASAPFDAELREELLALNTPGHDELARAALASNGLVGVYRAVVDRLLQASGVPAASVRAIGAHGQTVRHRPKEFDGIGYTLQINQPALLAEWTSIDVVADFRSRDLAAGGQGAPLAPAFHRAQFGRDGQPLGVLNIGGISNLSLLGREAPLGFDCGPGNALMDAWCLRHTGAPYDDRGRWAAGGRLLEPLLAALLAEPYLALPPPKSTGRDLFHARWLQERLAATGALDAPAQDVQHTLAEFTVGCITNDLQRHGQGIDRLVVCGGGAYNEHLLDRLRVRLPGVLVSTSDSVGVPPLQVEAAAFAWLAHRCIEREAGNMPSATGAAGPRVLGAVYPGRP